MMTWRATKPKSIPYEYIYPVSASGGKLLHWWVPYEDREVLFGRISIYAELVLGGFKASVPAHLAGKERKAGKLVYAQRQTINSLKCVVSINAVVEQGLLVSIAIYWQEGGEERAHQRLTTLAGQLRLSSDWLGIPEGIPEAAELAKAMYALSLELLNVTA